MASACEFDQSSQSGPIYKERMRINGGGLKITWAAMPAVNLPAEVASIVPALSSSGSSFIIRRSPAAPAWPSPHISRRATKTPLSRSTPDGSLTFPWMVLRLGIDKASG
ncbi:hypothetical protein B5807_05997 [Epicoccum nigrum]|uniref:Uncharacterized protein n=1 Tax=Epicoccum nigrum TaxID=105696 RepID=A0A1Y2M437_EPING|nr:hypothetical protein B5807_05997 [Epicoccum nigrum]